MSNNNFSRKSAEKYTRDQDIAIYYNSHTRFFFLADLTILLISPSLYPTDFAHFCALSSEASNSSAEGSFKGLSMMTSPEVYATSLSPVSIDRRFRMLTGKEICPLEETVNICVLIGSIVVKEKAYAKNGRFSYTRYPDTQR